MYGIWKENNFKNINTQIKALPYKFQKVYEVLESIRYDIRTYLQSSFGWSFHNRQPFVAATEIKVAITGGEVVSCGCCLWWCGDWGSSTMVRAVASVQGHMWSHYMNLP